MHFSHATNNRFSFGRIRAINWNGIKLNANVCDLRLCQSSSFTLSHFGTRPTCKLIRHLILINCCVWFVLKKRSDWRVVRVPSADFTIRTRDCPLSGPISEFDLRSCLGKLSKTRSAFYEPSFFLIRLFSFFWKLICKSNCYKSISPLCKPHFSNEAVCPNGF